MVDDARKVGGISFQTFEITLKRYEIGIIRDTEFRKVCYSANDLESHLKSSVKVLFNISHMTCYNSRVSYFHIAPVLNHHRDISTCL